MVGIAAAQAVVEAALRFGIVRIALVEAAVWVAWTIWHKVLFGRARIRFLRNGDRAYRAAFLTHIFPGITVGFSQMLRPAWNGVNLRNDAVFPRWPNSALDVVSMVAGWALLVAATLLFASAWRVLGAARVGFVPEFITPERFTPVRSGPYGAVRHPLFWSGVFCSLAIALICPSPAAFVLAFINLGYGLIYNQLEDRRLVAVFGPAYGDYSEAVPHIIPRGMARRPTEKSPAKPRGPLPGSW
jgi:protein-S-isoprenylcysteine O-methyltransferase Ste14